MSGQVVIVSAAASGTALAAVASGAALIAAGSIAYQMWRSHQAEQRAQARQQMRAAKQKLADWESFQSAQEADMKQLRNSREAARNALSELSLQQHTMQQESEQDLPQTGAQAQSFLDTENMAVGQQQLQQMTAWLENLAPELVQQKNSPVPALQAQLPPLQQQLASTPLLALENIRNFVATTQRSITHFAEQLNTQSQQVKHIQQRASNLLETLLTYQHLAETGTQQEEVLALQQHLLTILNEPSVQTGALDVLEKKSQQLQGSIDSRLEEAALQETIRSRVDFHLQALGYSAVSSSQEGLQSWQIPGGEQVRFALQPNYKLSFQVAHEREQRSEAALSLAERAFLQQQENKWCKDLPKLLQALKQDGFQYQVEFESQLPEQAIPVVVLETVEAILAEQEAEEVRFVDPAKKYHTK
ncbi:hypothetical protein QUF61_01070 [Candidatus Venteria ishoeyi]|uniref:hypothetical protein n=1 Tax=Candidatus Venteria ishoeyi TaxID=1899563 RepID=UPI0025A67931|nr:hypothetical protein [Candidatus Venteria ishoeyi]MDM8545063.1 hypothetical protein [Candidatus Venteria ishoeyi]